MDPLATSSNSPTTPSDNDPPKLVITSFGRRNGPLVPEPALTFDLRKLPNPPKHVRTSQSGLHKPLQEWLLSNPEVQSVVRDVCTSIDGCLKEALDNGEKSISVGVCCQLGKHRSVAVVETLGRRKFDGWDVVVNHRDVFQEKTKIGRERERQKARSVRDRSGLYDPE